LIGPGKPQLLCGRWSRRRHDTSVAISIAEYDDGVIRLVRPVSWCRLPCHRSDEPEQIRTNFGFLPGRRAAILCRDYS
jgi:hypothetical protein